MVSCTNLERNKKRQKKSAVEKQKLTKRSSQKNQISAFTQLFFVVSLVCILYRRKTFILVLDRVFID